MRIFTVLWPIMRPGAALGPRAKLVLLWRLTTLILLKILILLLLLDYGLWADVPRVSVVKGGTTLPLE